MGLMFLLHNMGFTPCLPPKALNMAQNIFLKRKQKRIHYTEWLKIQRNINPCVPSPLRETVYFQ